MRIEHIAINVLEPVVMARWYEEHLGMRVVRRHEGPTETHFLADGAGRVVLEIYHNPAALVPDYPTQDPLVFHIAFAVDDIEAVRSRLIAAGAKPVGEIRENEAGDKLAMLQDPWGVGVQLVTRREPL